MRVPSSFRIINKAFNMVKFANKIRGQDVSPVQKFRDEGERDEPRDEEQLFVSPITHLSPQGRGSSATQRLLQSSSPQHAARQPLLPFSSHISPLSSLCFSCRPLQARDQQISPNNKPRLQKTKSSSNSQGENIKITSLIAL